MVKLYKDGHLFKPKRGRPRGKGEETKQVGVVLVGLVDELTKKTGKYNEQIFADLAARGFENLSLDRLKSLYYQTKRDLSPQVFFLDERRYVVSGEQAKQLKAQLEEKAGRFKELQETVDLNRFGLGATVVRLRKK